MRDRENICEALATKKMAHRQRAQPVGRPDPSSQADRLPHARWPVTILTLSDEERRSRWRQDHPSLLVRTPCRLGRLVRRPQQIEDSLDRRKGHGGDFDAEGIPAGHRAIP